MHGEQCNFCGGYDDSSTRSVAKCSHCKSSLVCNFCRKNHEGFCAEIQQRKARGEGATIAGVTYGAHRHGHEIPEEVRTPAPQPFPRGTVEETATFIAETVVAGLHELIAPAKPRLESVPPHTILVPLEPADQAMVDDALAGITDLLSE